MLCDWRVYVPIAIVGYVLIYCEYIAASDAAEFTSPTNRYLFLEGVDHGSSLLRARTESERMSLV